MTTALVPSLASLCPAHLKPFDHAFLEAYSKLEVEIEVGSSENTEVGQRSNEWEEPVGYTYVHV